MTKGAGRQEPKGNKGKKKKKKRTRVPAPGDVSQFPRVRLGASLFASGYPRNVVNVGN